MNRGGPYDLSDIQFKQKFCMLFKGRVPLGSPLPHGASALGFFGPLLPIGMSTVYTCFLERTQKLNKPGNAGY